MKDYREKPVKSRYWFLVIIFAFVVYSENSISRELKPFTSDGCSAFPDGTFSQRKLWLQCCTDHDFAYWKGGTYKERLQADIELRNCVWEVVEEEVALIMLAGVRVGGSPFFPTKFRWGYGWTYPRFYGPLSEKELDMIRNITDCNSQC